MRNRDLHFEVTRWPTRIFPELMPQTKRFGLLLSNRTFRHMAASMIQRVSRGLRGRRVAHRRIQTPRSIQNKSRSWLNQRTYLSGIRAIITFRASFRRRKSATYQK